jgi:hypothetical protein
MSRASRRLGTIWRYAHDALAQADEAIASA